MHDGAFWVYFSIALFFGILGTTAIVTNKPTWGSLILTLWISSMLAFVVSTFTGYRRHFFEANTCCSPSPYSGWPKWILVNSLFIIVLICATSWIYELGSSSIWGKLSGILALLGGVFLLQLNGNFDFFAMVYCGLWLFLLSYTLVGW